MNTDKKYQVKFRLNESDYKKLKDVLEYINLNIQEFFFRLVYFGEAWYVKDEASLVEIINNTSYQISMLCRNFRILAKELEENKYDEQIIEYIYDSIAEIEYTHTRYIGKIKIDQL